MRNEPWEFDWKWLKEEMVMAYISNLQGGFLNKFTKKEILMGYISESCDSKKGEWVANYMSKSCDL